MGTNILEKCQLAEIIVDLVRQVWIVGDSVNRTNEKLSAQRQVIAFVSRTF